MVLSLVGIGAFTSGREEVSPPTTTVAPAVPASPAGPRFPLPPDLPPPPPPPPPCRDEVAELGTFTAALSNCSSSPASRIAEFVLRTDAAYEGLIRHGDRLLANNQWVAWVDTQDAPGILRGLWGVDAGANFVGITEPDIAADAAKSVLSISKGFFSTDAPHGYKGLHVEIWKTLDRTPPDVDECAPVNCVYTVANTRFEETPETVRTTPTQVDARYHAPLVNLHPPTSRCPWCGTTMFVGLNGATAQLIWQVNYILTPYALTVGTALGATADVEFSGAAGGLLLLLNAGCRATARDAYPGDRHFRGCDPAQVAERSLHTVEGPAIATGKAAPGSDKIVVSGDQADFFAPEFQAIGPHEDRFVNQHNDASPFTFRYQDGRVAVTATPGWAVGNPQATDWMTGFAVHFNSTPNDLGYDADRGLSGVSGIASLDAYTQPSCLGPCRLAVGPTHGLLFWSMNLAR